MRRQTLIPILSDYGTGGMPNFFPGCIESIESFRLDHLRLVRKVTSLLRHKIAEIGRIPVIWITEIKTKTLARNHSPFWANAKGNDEFSHRERINETHFDTGAAVGGVAGGAAGVLAGLGILAIPGIGPVVAAGWLVAAAVGATAGAAAGGLTGLFIAAGLSCDDANFYAEGIRRGGTVVTVKPDDKHMAVAEQILRRGTVSPIERGKLYRDSGWREFNPEAVPYTPAEIETERQRCSSF
jgi:hypothetical protein